MRKANFVYAGEDRINFSIIYDELWDSYLPYLGPAAALLYCYLLRLSRHGISGPGGPGWQAEVCAPLGLSVPDSHQCWARLQEFGLLYPASDGSYTLGYPKTKEELNTLLADFMPLQQLSLPSVSVESSIKSEAMMRSQRRNRANKTLFSFVEQEFGRALSMTEMERVLALEKTYARDLIELAVELAIIAQARSLAYIEQILVNWHLKGITTAAAARQDSEQHRQQKSRRNRKSKSKQALEATKDEEDVWDDLDLYRPRPKEDKQ